MEHCLVYMTAGSLDEARRIGKALVEEHLAACVNILPAVESLYVWDGALQRETETAFLAKTTAGRFPELERRVRELHSYEVPCIVALPLKAGNPAFLDWITVATQGA